MGAFRRGLVWAFRRIIGVYFREIEVLGEAPPKGTRSRVFVSNHVNGIVDPILVLTAAPCDISPVAKSTLPPKDVATGKPAALRPAHRAQVLPWPRPPSAAQSRRRPRKVA